jgi:hypothetical protein
MLGCRFRFRFIGGILSHFLFQNKNVKPIANPAV